MTIYEQIYHLAEPYWQTRMGHIHMPESYRLAQKLLQHYPEADASIVLPAILLHDVGYTAVPEDDQLKGLAGAPMGWQPDITRLHEVEGVRIAGELLSKVGYDPQKIAAIQEVIDGHDSRTVELNLEDAIVKDADKLWRFTKSGVEVCHVWTGRTPQDFMDWIVTKIDGWMLTERGNQMAHEILAATRTTYQGVA